ncbi:hypothetical protein ACHAXH_000141 [Discostella pseudostelligera]
MLAPLTDLVGECGQTKVTKAKGTKKVPWHWDAVHQKAFDAVKTTIAKDVVLAYPDYDKVFEVYTEIWLESVVRPKSPKLREQKRYPGTRTRSIKRHSMQ